MAKEAVMRELGPNGGNPVRFTVKDSNAFSKGAIVFLVDPKTISGATSIAIKPVAGIAAADKEADDAATDIACYTEGIADCYAGTAFVAGSLVTVSGGNYVKAANTLDKILSGMVLGRALQSASVNDVVLIKLGAKL